MSRLYIKWEKLYDGGWKILQKRCDGMSVCICISRFLKGVKNYFLPDLKPKMSCFWMTPSALCRLYLYMDERGCGRWALCCSFFFCMFQITTEMFWMFFWVASLRSFFVKRQNILCRYRCTRDHPTNGFAFSKQF